jgi:hypothetical protein
MNSSKPYLVQVKASLQGDQYVMQPMNYKDRFRKHKLPIGREDMKNLLSKIGATDNATIPKSAMNQTYDEMMDDIEAGKGALINIWSSKYPMEDYIAVEQSFQELTLSKDKVIEGELFKKGTRFRIKQEI